MKISVENLGVLRQADFELGDLTLICGENNTGKTYATYALFGFLFSWKNNLNIKIPDHQVNDLLNDGVMQIDIEHYVQKTNDILKRGCLKYSKTLPEIFATNSAYFNDSTFQVELADQEIEEILKMKFETEIRISRTDSLSLTKAKGKKTLVASLVSDKKTANKNNLFFERRIKYGISTVLLEIIFGQLLPKPFIVSAERTGVAIFRKELNFARNRLLEEMIKADKDVNLGRLLRKSYNDYALPVKESVDFSQRLEIIAKENGFLAKNHPQILNDFADIIGGEYIRGSNDTIYFRPKEKQIKFAMGESSSAVRSLLEIGFYLRHVAKPGELLMVDEPELNLHPKNQRRIARLLVRLVNLGIRVFITTHSDYIVKEINALIMLNQDKPYLKQIAKKEGYQTEELIAPEKVRVYIAEKAQIKLKNNTRKSQCQTLVAANIDAELGIEVRSFDETINKMNQIQEDIVWGGDE